MPAKLRKRQIPPESPWREPGPADTLIPTSSLQNCERIHFSCFSKASRWRCFVTSPAENTHWPSPLGRARGRPPAYSSPPPDVPRLHPLSRPPCLRCPVSCCLSVPRAPITAHVLGCSPPLLGPRPAIQPRRPQWGSQSHMNEGMKGGRNG